MASNTAPQVGPGKYTGKVTTPKVVTPTPTPTATPTKTSASIFSKIDANLANKGVSVPTVTGMSGGSLIDIAVQDKAKAVFLGKLLKARGKQVGASVEAIKNLFLSEPELATLAGQADGDYNKLVSLLSQDFLPELGKQPAAPNYPSRNIYKYTDEDLDTLVNNVYQEKLMRPASQEELAKERKKIRPQLEQGTLSTTKNVKNPKTGKMETVTVQEGGPTKEAVATSIASQLETLNPDEVDRTARINFSSWLSQNAQGA